MGLRAKSAAVFQRAKQLMPGGVNSPARAFGGVGGEPIVFVSGQGAHLTDLDGNRYIDYIGSWGPMILGHCHPRVTAAIQEAVSRGTSFGAPTAAENELAELIIQAVPSVEMVRLVNSGTEATMSAIRVARGYTGRDVIVNSPAIITVTSTRCWSRPAVRQRRSACPTLPASPPAPAKTRWSCSTTILRDLRTPSRSTGTASPRSSSNRWSATWGPSSRTPTFCGP